MLIRKYSKTGSRHEILGVENQDYLCSVETDDCAAVMLADGASACSRAQDGAKLCCDAVAYVIRKEGAAFFHYPKEKMAWLLKEQILYWIECHKDATEELTDYGSTFILAFMEKKNGRTVLVNLGDGAILTASEKNFSWLMRPKKFGANPCLMTTKGVMKAIDIRVLNIPVGQKVLLCSDGFLYSLPEVLGKDCRVNDWGEVEEALLNAQTPDDSSYIMMERK